MSSITQARTPREILHLYHRAMINMNADDLADLYVAEAIHEFPFLAPGFPERYVGQEEIRRGYSKNWEGAGIQVRAIKNAAIHEIGDEVIISEWVGEAMILAEQRDLTITGLLIITVQDGMIIHTSDYMDALGLAVRTGRLSDLALEADQPSTVQTEVG